MNREERILAYIVAVATVLTWLGLNPTNLIEATVSGLSIEIKTRIADSIAYTIASGGATYLVFLYAKRRFKGNPTGAKRFQKVLGYALAGIAIVLAMTYGSLSILLVVNYASLTEFGAFVVASFVFGASCCVGFASRVITDAPPKTALTLPLICSPLFLVVGGYVLFLVSGFL